jgi:hypothetical protein
LLDQVDIERVMKSIREDRESRWILLGSLFDASSFIKALKLCKPEVLIGNFI